MCLHINEKKRPKYRSYTERTIFPFLFTLNGIWSWWQFSFRYSRQPNRNLFGSKAKGKLSPRLYPIQFERKWETSFVSVIHLMTLSIRLYIQRNRSPFEWNMIVLAIFPFSLEPITEYCYLVPSKREIVSTIILRSIWKETDIYYRTVSWRKYWAYAGKTWNMSPFIFFFLICNSQVIALNSFKLYSTHKNSYTNRWSTQEFKLILFINLT